MKITAFHLVLGCLGLVLYFGNSFGDLETIMTDLEAKFGWVVGNGPDGAVPPAIGEPTAAPIGAPGDAPATAPDAGQAAAATQPPEILARWTQLAAPSKACGSTNLDDVQSGDPESCRAKVLVRAIIDPKGDCGEVALLRGQTRLSMQTRDRPKGASETAFAVVVCEALLEIDDQEVTFADNNTLSWKGLRELDKITVVGDTGCNPKDGQTCSGGSWPFADIAAAAAKTAPDLVVHVGDYRYLGGDGGDIWQNWQKDFFTPAEPLLEAAPWIMARGNHESCFGKQGPGWFYFLEPEYQHVSNCVANDPQGTGDLGPYAVDLAVPQPNDHAAGLRFIVLDSTDAKYQCKKWAMEFENKHTERLEKLIAAPGGRDAWIITHYPIWDVSAHRLLDDPDRDKYLLCEGKYYNAQSVHRYRKLLASAIGNQASVVLSGDTHHFQVLRKHDSGAAEATYPLQLVAGNGGTLLTPGLGAELPSKLYEDTCEREPPVRYFERKMRDQEGWVLGKAACEYGSVAAIHDRTEGWSFELMPVPGAHETEPVATTCGLGDSYADACYRNDGSNCVTLGSEDRDCSFESFQGPTNGK